MQRIKALLKPERARVFDFVHARRFRMLGWLVLALLLSVAVFLIAPHQISVSVYKLSLVVLGAYAAYWIDRALFPYARPDVFLCRVCERSDKTPQEELLWLGIAGTSMLRRAIIVAAVVVAVGLGA